MNTHKFIKFAKDNTPLILTSIGVAGTVSTAVLSARAAVQSHEAIQDGLKYDLRPEDLTFKDKVSVCWPFWIPVAVNGAVTIACIVAANTVSTKRQIALASAYTLSEGAFREYKDKVLEIHGENKARQIDEAVVKERYEKQPLRESVVIMSGRGEDLFYDSQTARYFKSDMESIRAAQNDINRQIMETMYASMNDFFHLIGLPSAGIGDELGWTNDNRLDIKFVPMMADNGKPCISLIYEKDPVRDYFRLG